MTNTKPKIRLSSLILANILIPVAVLVFATGFFPYKPVLSGLATFEEVETEEHGLGLLSKDERPEGVFDKVIFMVVDALRSDFVYGHGSGFAFTQSLIRTGAAVPFTAHAAPPTVTMPRVKGLTSGSVPSFLDLILNFAESDTSSSLASQDTWLAQIKKHLHSAGEEEGKLVFYGDDTWLKLFPDFFARTDGTSSFFVSDFTEVDNNVTRHVPSELEQPDWNAMIMHYLGLDHIGHKSGPLSPNMLPKQQEMDGIVQTIYEAMNSLPHLENTLLVLAGDHGMNSAGNHGGSAAGETSPALVFVSPKLREITCGADSSPRLSAPNSAPEIKPPVSAAAFFALEQKQKMIRVKAGVVQDDLTAYLAQIWNAMSQADKAVYERLALLDRIRFEEDQEKAHCKLPVPYKAPAEPKDGTEFNYYHHIQQSDLVPTMAALLGVPVSKNNLGIVIPEFLQFWNKGNAKGKLRPDHQLLYRNSLQVLRILKAAYGDVPFEETLTQTAAPDPSLETCKGLSKGGEQLSCMWRLVQYTLAHADGSESNAVFGSMLTDFLTTAQDTLSASASSYNVPRLVAGVVVAILAAVFAVNSRQDRWAPTTAGIFFVAMTALYGIMMFATSYVEEEQHLWYWMTSAWILILYFVRPTSPPSSISSSAIKAKAASGTTPSSPASPNAAIATILLLAAHRLTTRWNQTGQKYAGADDVAHTFFPAHHLFLWMLVLATYVHLAIRFATRTLVNLASPELCAMTALSLIVPSLIFKVNFTQADSPELVQGLATEFRKYTAAWDLVLQARASFVGLGVAAVAIVLLLFLRRRWLGEDDIAAATPLPQRLHDLLTLFLVNQTRVQSIPLFLVFELQLQMLTSLLSPPEPPASEPAKSPETTDPSSASALPNPPPPIPPTLLVSISLLLLTHVSYFALGGSNAISSLDLSNAYNGVSSYNVFAVGVLLFASNWAGPIWWSTAAVLLLQRLRDGSLPKAKLETIEEKDKRKQRAWVEKERLLLKATAADGEAGVKVNEEEGERALWAEHISALTIFICAGLAAVMAACTVLRTHLFIWTVFSPKYLYAMAWGLAWHLIVNICVGGLLYRMGRR